MRGEGAEVGELVAERYHLAVERGGGDEIRLGLLAFAPRSALGKRAGLMLHESGHSLSELFVNLFDGHIRILHGVVQDSGCQHLRVIRDACNDGGRFHGMYDERVSLAFPFHTPVRLNRQPHRSVK